MKAKPRASRRRRDNAADVRGAAAAIVDATQGVTGVVQNMHSAIGAFPIVTDLVYAAVKGVTGVVGVAVDALVTALGPLLGESAPGPEREAVLAALNGVVGDHLAATNNALAIQMSLRPPLDGLPGGGTLLVLVHGSCMNDLQWTRGGHDHGRALARALGFTPAYVHYNTGLHTSTNGAALAALLEKESAPFRDLVIVAHSMGGLVSRAAVHVAEDATQRHAWRSKLRALVTLGTPHHGAMLERGGNLFETLLGVTPWSAPLAALGRIRSPGVTDLRFGNVVDADWVDRDRFALGSDPRTPTPLPEGVRCYALAGTTSAGPVEGTARVDALASDDLVSVRSALGAHEDPRFALRFTNARIFPATHHLDLLSSSAVYASLAEWLRDDRLRPAP